PRVTAAAALPSTEVASMRRRYRRGVQRPRGRVLDRRAIVGAHAHFVERVAHRMHGRTHFIGADRADATDAEGFHLSQLARIEDETLVADARVEVLEREARIAGRL